MNSLAYHGTSVLISVVCIGVSIAIIFFAYASQLESKATQMQIDDMVKNADILQLDPAALSVLQSFIRTIEPDVLAHLPSDAQAVKTNNQRILMWTAIVLGIIVTITVGVVATLYWVFALPIVPLLLESITSTLLVDIVYILFVTFFASKYRTIDQNAVLKAVLNTIQTASPGPAIHF